MRVVVPTCGHPADDDMVGLIAEQFPGREAFGLDIGSTTVKGVVLQGTTVLFSAYRRHHADARGALREALGLVFGYAVGVDLTRRDIQNDLKARRHPWEAAKSFDRSAPVSGRHLKPSKRMS